MADFDALVVGAGAVGLACAAELAATGRTVAVLETAAYPGAGISSRNSEVIHSGLYYPTGSLKHELCVRGRRLLYEYLDRHGVAHRKCGKLVVATDAAEMDKVEALFALGQANGVEGLTLLTQSEIAALEEQVVAVGGLIAAETGIFDTHQYLLALVADIEHQGGHVAFRTPFEGAESHDGEFRVRIGGEDPWVVSAPILINSAGLSAPDVALRIEGIAAETVPSYRLAKGSYFRFVGRAPFSHLVYPAPVDGGLGVHATLDLAGNLRFGPDVEWLNKGATEEDMDYLVSPDRADSFYNAIRRYWPSLPDGSLEPDFSGCRPKLVGPGVPAADFAIQSGGVQGSINLYGIESPGLTSSLAIAQHVVQLLGSEI